jgi:hypothetical protein
VGCHCLQTNTCYTRSSYAIHPMWWSPFICGFTAVHQHLHGVMTFSFTNTKIITGRNFYIHSNFLLCTPFITFSSVIFRRQYIIVGCAIHQNLIYESTKHFLFLQCVGQNCPLEFGRNHLVSWTPGSNFVVLLDLLLYGQIVEIKNLDTYYQ